MKKRRREKEEEDEEKRRGGRGGEGATPLRSYPRTFALSPVPAHPDVELLHVHLPRLPHPPRPPDGLLLQRRVEARLQQEDVVGRGEGDPHTA